MKNIKSFIFGLLAVAGFTGFTACQDDIDAPASATDVPVAEHDANMTILDLKKLYWQEETNYCVEIEPLESGEHVYIKGRVISSDYEGNVFRSLSIQDETAAISFSVFTYNLYLNYRYGQELVIDVTGMHIGKYNGLLQIGYPEWYENGQCWETSFMSPDAFHPAVELNGNPEPDKVEIAVFNDFSSIPISSPEDLMTWQSRIVRVNNVSFSPQVYTTTGKTVTTFGIYEVSNFNQKAVDKDGATMTIRTSGYSNFWNVEMPTEKGDIIALLGFYGGAWQMSFNDLEQGLQNFGNPTLPLGDKGNPWTVEQAIDLEMIPSNPNGWVKGYIVGTVAPEVEEIKSSSDIDWGAEATMENTVVIAPTVETTDIAKCLVISLPQGSLMREKVALKNNPENFGKELTVYGKLDLNMGTYGITGNSGTGAEFMIDGESFGDGPLPGSGIPEGDGTQASPYNPTQMLVLGAPATAIADTYVKGYIVGYVPDKALSEAVFGAPATVATNILIATVGDENNASKVLPVQLPTGTVRNSLNLKDNPGNLGKIVTLCGSFEKYFGTAGLKSVTSFELEGGDTPTPPVTGDGDGTEAKPFSCAQVIALNPQSTTEAVKSGVWVDGYIVGFYYDYGPHFTAENAQAANVLISDDPNASAASQCVCIQLVASTDTRSAVNLKDNPGNLGKKVQLYGDVMKYNTLPGIKNTSNYKLDGGSTPTPPVSGDPVSSIDQNFDASTAIPSGWSNVQIAGNKAWYIPTFDGNNYAAMTGYKGTAPFDSWLVTPAVDMSKVADKTLSFDTQVNGYGSTTSVFEVYVLTSADVATATKTKLNCEIATAPASGYSSWVNSGNIDLSSYSGTIYIGFRYYATSDANYATWCVDNVKLNAAGETPTPPTPPAPAGEYKGDFDSFNGGTPKASPYGTYTNATGWTAENSIILGGTTGDDANPRFQFIGGETTLAVNINGKASAPGKIISPVLTGGIKTLTFKYGTAYNTATSKFSFTVKVLQNGAVVKEETLTPDMTIKTAYDFSMDVNVSGDFSIEIVNNAPSQATSNLDRVAIWNLTWD